jgi:hypothetical protein
VARVLSDDDSAEGKLRMFKSLAASPLVALQGAVLVGIVFSVKTTDGHGPGCGLLVGVTKNRLFVSPVNAGPEQAGLSGFPFP